MKNMNITGKLIAGFIIVTILTGIAGIAGILGMLSLKQAGEETFSNKLTTEDALGSIREAYKQELVYLKEMLINIEEPDVVNTNIEKVNSWQMKAKSGRMMYRGMANGEPLPGAFYDAEMLMDGLYSETKGKIIAAVLAGDAKSVREGLKDASAYVTIIENDLKVTEHMHDAKIEGKYNSTAGFAGVLIIALVGIIALAVLITYAMKRYIICRFSKPITEMTALISKVGAKGDISFEQSDAAVIDRHADCNDEISLAITAYAALVQRLTGLNNVLNNLADGNFSEETEILSDKDVMGHAIYRIAGNLKLLFNQIHTALNQLYCDIGSLASGALALAQGSADQTASVKELSGFITEAAGKAGYQKKDTNNLSHKSSNHAESSNVYEMDWKKVPKIIMMSDILKNSKKFNNERRLSADSGD